MKMGDKLKYRFLIKYRLNIDQRFALTIVKNKIR